MRSFTKGHKVKHKIHAGTELHPEKSGRKLLVGKEIEGITKVMEQTSLAETGRLIKWIILWAKSLLKRMNFTKRRVTTKCSRT